MGCLIVIFLFGNVAVDIDVFDQWHMWGFLPVGIQLLAALITVAFFV